jgi:ribosome-associated protein
MKSDLSDLVTQLARTLYMKKGENVIVLDLREISAVTDFVVIASGNVERHVMALSKDLQDLMKKKGHPPAHVEGMSHGDWGVLDYVEIVIHLFIPKMRQKYQLERLWSDAKILDIDLDYATTHDEER